MLSKLNFRKRETKRTVVGLLAQLGPKELWWNLSSDVKLNEEQPSAVAKSDGYVISFSGADKEVVLLNKSGSADVFKDFISDFGEDVTTTKIKHGRKIKKNSSSEAWEAINSKCVYGTYQSRFDSLEEGVKLIPGLAIIRSLLSKNEAVKDMVAPFVTGLFFESAINGPQALILLLCTEEGVLSNLDYIPIVGGDPSAAIKLFVQSNKLSSTGELSAERIAIFSSEDINNVVAEIDPYPREKEFLGYSVNALLKGGAWVSGGASLLAFAFAGYLYFQNEQIRVSQSKNSFLYVETLDRLNAVISGPKLGAILNLKTVSARDAINLTSQVWVDGSLVSLEATSDLTRLKVEYEFNSNAVYESETMNFLTKEAPNGCKKLPIETNAQLNLLTAIYECEKLNPIVLLLNSIPR